MANTNKTYLPQQKVKRGKAGYRGKDIVVVDPEVYRKGKLGEAESDAPVKASKGK